METCKLSLPTLQNISLQCRFFMEKRLQQKNSANMIKILRNVLLQFPIFYNSFGPFRNQTSAFCITDQYIDFYMVPIKQET